MSLGTLTVRVRGVPFPIEFADWARRRRLVEQIERIVKGFVAELMRVIREEVVGGVDAMFETASPTVKTHPFSNLTKNMEPERLARIKTETDAAVKRIGAKANLAKPKRKAPIQLCPVPKCTGRAAPLYGMVCSKHKDVPKTKIAKYREARRKKNGN